MARGLVLRALPRRWSCPRTLSCACTYNTVARARFTATPHALLSGCPTVVGWRLSFAVWGAGCPRPSGTTGQVVQWKCRSPTPSYGRMSLCPMCSTKSIAGLPSNSACPRLRVTVYTSLKQARTTLAVCCVAPGVELNASPQPCLSAWLVLCVVPLSCLASSLALTYGITYFCRYSKKECVVFRRYSDFDWLRKKLLANNPGAERPRKRLRAAAASWTVAQCKLCRPLL